jgi:hypothetical protein
VARLRIIRTEVSIVLGTLANYAVRLRSAEFQSDPHVLDGFVQRAMLDQPQQSQYYKDHNDDFDPRSEGFDDQ